MNKVIAIIIVLFSLLPQAFAQGMSERKVGKMKVGTETVYCREVDHDGGPTYVISLADQKIFQLSSKKKNPTIDILWQMAEEDRAEVFGFPNGKRKDLDKLKTLATDTVVNKACKLKGFRWSKRKYTVWKY